MQNIKITKAKKINSLFYSCFFEIQKTYLIYICKDFQNKDSFFMLYEVEIFNERANSITNVITPCLGFTSLWFKF